MKRKTSYTRGPYSKKEKRLVKPDEIIEMIIELKNFRERIKVKFVSSHYRTRILESTQREIDVLEKLRKKNNKLEDEIQDLRNRINDLEKEKEENFEIDYDNFLEKIEFTELEELMNSASSYCQTEPAETPALKMVSELDNESNK